VVNCRAGILPAAVATNRHSSVVPALLSSQGRHSEPRPPKLQRRWIVEESQLDRFTPKNQRGRETGLSVVTAYGIVSSAREAFS
jgi:hypothetical protein